MSAGSPRSPRSPDRSAADSETPVHLFAPCILDSHRERRAQGEKIHGAGRWSVQRMDAATDVAMALFNRVRTTEDTNAQDSVRICQNTFRHGCSVALISFPPTSQDMQSEYVERKKQVLPLHLGKLVRTADRAAAEYVGKPNFTQYKQSLRDEAESGVLV